jgi:GT2 family glycosyltransferase
MLTEKVFCAPSRSVTLIVLAWNSWNLTRTTLDSLRSTDLTDASVIVVDNGSSDETASGLEIYRDWVTVVRLPKNVGYVRGNNAGILKAEPSTDIVLLNNDLIFMPPNWLQRLR